MKVAVAMSGNQISEHFGRCSCFLIVTVEEEEIRSREVVDAPPHEQGVLPDFLKEHGVEYLLTGGIGRRAVQYFDQMGITIYSGVSGSVDEALSNFLTDRLEPGGDVCEGHHGHGDH